MPSPLGHAHGRAQVPVIMWLDYYAENTFGVEVLDNATTILGWKSEPQPDALLRVLPECGGRSHDEEGYIHGARSSWSKFPRQPGTWTWGQRRPITSGPGCWNTSSAIEPDEIFWFGQEQGVLVPRPIGDDGLYRSTVFPGLWLDPAALLKGDRRRLRAVVELGCATPEHAAFVARLAKPRAPS